MPRAHPVPRQRRHRDRLVRSHQLARTRRSRERESLGCQRCGTRTPLGWKKGARGLFRLIPRRRKFVSSTDCLTAAVHGRLQLADAGSSVRRVRHHFADVQDRALNGRFEANSSESRPSEAGHFRTSDRQEACRANDQFESSAAIGRRPLEGAHPPKQSLEGRRRLSTPDACRTSTPRSAEQVLPTPYRPSPVSTRSGEADNQRPQPRAC
jgi:hypothetical protein